MATPRTLNPAASVHRKIAAAMTPPEVPTLTKKTKAVKGLPDMHPGTEPLPRMHTSQDH